MTTIRDCIQYIQDGKAVDVRGREVLLGMLSEAEAGNWIPVTSSDRFPEPGKPVLVAIDRGEKREYGKRYIVARAVWVGKFTEEDTNEDFYDDGDYDEVTDTWYWPEGWYEWNIGEERHYFLGSQHPVTHWMPLPEGPAEAP